MVSSMAVPLETSAMVLVSLPPVGCPLPTCQPAPESKPTCSRQRSFQQAREHFEAAQPPGPGTLADLGALEVRMSEDHLSRGAAVEQLHGNQRLATELLTGLLREAFPGPCEDQFLRRLHLAECALADVLAVRKWNLDDVTAAWPNVEFHIFGIVRGNVLAHPFFQLFALGPGRPDPF